MTLYLTDTTTPEEIYKAKRCGKVLFYAHALRLPSPRAHVSPGLVPRKT